MMLRSMVSLLVVTVPVLSEHKMVIPANSSMAMIRVTMDGLVLRELLGTNG